MNPRTARLLLCGAALLVAAGCSSHASAGTGATAAPASGSGGNAAPAGNPGAPGRGAPPAASGSVAAVSGSTMQVQNPQDGQVAVTWTATTSFTDTVTVGLSGIKPGDCVTATAPPGTDRNASTFTAQRITVSAPVGGTCTGGFGSGGRAFPSGRPSGARPSGFPSGRPSGLPSGAGRAAFGAVVFGSVTSVSGHTVVVVAREFGTSGTSSKSVTVGSATVVTTQRTGTSAAVRVGRCVVVQGRTDSSGAVTATQVRVTDPVDGQCRSGRGGFGGFGGN